MFSIATWNVNSLRVRLEHVTDWLQTQRPDFVALQETKLEDVNFPAEALREQGYHVCFSGQKTYNGVAILSRTPPRDVVTDIPGLVDEQRRILAATYTLPDSGAEVRVIDLYVPNGGSVDSDKYVYKLDWLDKVTAYIVEQLVAYPHLVVLGDFNIAPEERDVHDPSLWEGQVLFSAPERAAFQRLMEAGLCDTFRLFEQEPEAFSWWDYRMGAFRRNLGLRIDHVLASRALCELCTASRIDKEPRRLQRPSDHAPVIADFAL